MCFGEGETDGKGVELVYTFQETVDREFGDTAIVVTRGELENLRYILREYARNEVSRGMVEQVSFWLSVLANDEEAV